MNSSNISKFKKIKTVQITSYFSPMPITKNVWQISVYFTLKINNWIVQLSAGQKKSNCSNCHFLSLIQLCDAISTVTYITWFISF